MGNNDHYWTRKEELSTKAKEHTELMEEQYQNAIGDCVKNSIIYGGDHKSPEPFVPTHSGKVHEPLLVNHPSLK